MTHNDDRPEQPEKPPQQKSKAAAALSALSAAGTSPAYGAPSPPAAAGSGVGSGDGSGVGSGGGGGDCGRLQTGFDFLCVLDFEATCQEGKRLANQEVIEFPSVLIDGRTGNVVDMFEQYTSPVCNPRLSSFCTGLTGITQEMVSIENGALLFGDALARHRAWLLGHGLDAEHPGGSSHDPHATGKTFAFVTCGDWDLKTMLPAQLGLAAAAGLGRKPPAAFRSWINIKHAYKNQYKGSKGRAGGMAGMLDGLQMKLEGRHHSGIDDCKNIGRIVQRMLADGWSPTLTWTDR